jgi:hypothetical protein
MAAERLCAAPVVGFDVRHGTGNNRIYRVRTASAAYALKSYGTGQASRLRLSREYAALTLLAAAPTRAFVPRVQGVDVRAGYALFDWIEGTAPHAHTAADIDAVLEFLRGAHALRALPEAAELYEAAQACFSGRALLDQIAARIARLHAPAATHAALTEFLAREVEPLYAALAAPLEANATSTAMPLHVGARTLAPSDLSFHNALRRADGRLAFLDFEYFGWDDPVKFVADFVWHPGMALAPEHVARFVRGARSLYGATDGGFTERLRERFALFGVRWSLIILNEFLAEQWDRRRFAGDVRAWEDVKAIQLEKARRLLEHVRTQSRAAALC